MRASKACNGSLDTPMPLLHGVGRSNAVLQAFARAPHAETCLLACSTCVRRSVPSGPAATGPGTCSSSQQQQQQQQQPAAAPGAKRVCVQPSAAGGAEVAAGAGGSSSAAELLTRGRGGGRQAGGVWSLGSPVESRGAGRMAGGGRRGSTSGGEHARSVSGSAAPGAGAAGLTDSFDPLNYHRSWCPWVFTGACVPERWGAAVRAWLWAAECVRKGMRV